MLARADQHTVQTCSLRSADVVFDIVPNHNCLLRLHANREQRLLEKGAIGLTKDRCMLSRRQLQGIHKGAAIKLQSLICAPVEIGMSREQHRSIHKHSKCMIHGLVAEEFLGSTNHNNTSAAFNPFDSPKTPATTPFP